MSADSVKDTPVETLSEKTRLVHYQRHVNQIFGIVLHIAFFTFVLVRAILVRSRLRNNLSQLHLYLERRLKPEKYPRSHKLAYKLFGRFDITIPTFAQTVAVTFFTLLVLLCSTFGYTLREDSIEYQPTADQFVRYVATRFGVMAFAILPLLMLTAARLNVLVWLTHWTHDSWYLFHRWIGRLAWVCAITHAVLYSTYHLMHNQYWIKFTKLYWNCGILAISLLSLMTILSVRFFRRLSYEVFLYGHIFGTIVLILALFYHSMWERANGWLYLTLICWGIDRLFRICMTSSFYPLTGRVMHFGTLMRIDVLVPANIPVRPGQFAHLRFPKVRYLESHPFSIAAVTPIQNKRGSRDASTTTFSEVEWTPLISGREEKTASARTQALTFLIRPFDGMTRTLSDHLISAASAIRTMDRPTPMKVYFEGAYGNEHDLRSYDSILFLAGGVGITFTLPYLLKLNESYATKSFQRIHFVWVTRALHEIESLVSFLDRIDDELREHVEIFYTGRITSIGILLDSALTPSHRYWVEQVKVGRPEISNLLSSAVRDDEDLGSEPSSVAFLACGTGGMLDQCRQEVESLRAVSTASVTFIEEASTR